MLSTYLILEVCGKTKPAYERVTSARDEVTYHQMEFNLLILFFRCRTYLPSRKCPGILTILTTTTLTC